MISKWCHSLQLLLVSHYYYYYYIHSFSDWQHSRSTRLCSVKLRIRWGSDVYFEDQLRTGNLPLLAVMSSLHQYCSCRNGRGTKLGRLGMSWMKLQIWNTTTKFPQIANTKKMINILLPWIYKAQRETPRSVNTVMSTPSSLQSTDAFVRKPLPMPEYIRCPVQKVLHP